VKRLLKKLSQFFTDESGQGTMEYILIVGLIVIFLIVALYFFRDQLKAFIDKIGDWIGTAEPKALPGG
jgi:Flp pilus assembly pilin Flp